MSKAEFAQALGKRPSEVTKWLSSQHNFTLRTISLLSAFFGEELIAVKVNRYIIMASAKFANYG